MRLEATAHVTRRVVNTPRIVKPKHFAVAAKPHNSHDCEHASPIKVLRRTQIQTSNTDEIQGGVRMQITDWWHVTRPPKAASSRQTRGENPAGNNQRTGKEASLERGASLKQVAESHSGGVAPGDDGGIEEQFREVCGVGKRQVAVYRLKLVHEMHQDFNTRSQIQDACRLGAQIRAPSSRAHTVWNSSNCVRIPAQSMPFSRRSTRQRWRHNPFDKASVKWC